MLTSLYLTNSKSAIPQKSNDPLLLSISNLTFAFSKMTGDIKSNKQCNRIVNIQFLSQYKQLEFIRSVQFHILCEYVMLLNNIIAESCMSYHIRKLTPTSGNWSKQFKRSNSKSKPMKQLSNISPTKSQIRVKSKHKLNNKPSIQTLMFSKTSYVEQLNLTSTSWCVYDAKKSKYVGFRERTQREIASITKVMTTIIAVQFFQFHSIPQNTLVKVTESSARLNGTTAQLKANTWVHLWDLLYGSMLPSGNDAANLLSEYIGYFFKNPDQDPSSKPYVDLTQQNTNILTVQFIKQMNLKAQQLGLINTTFSNPHGLQNAMNLSTPKDIIILSQYVSSNPKFKEVMNKDTYRYYYYELDQRFLEQSLEDNNTVTKYKKQRRRWWNTNSLLSKGWQGIKTGQTVAAGSCLASLKNDIFIVVLNCRDNEARFSQTEKIYEWYTKIHRKKDSTIDSESDSL